MDRLEAFLVSEHKVEPSVFEKITSFGVESISDFVGLCTESDYEDGVKELLPAELSANRIQLSRLRVAWARARQDIKSAINAPTLEEELEAPLPNELRQKQEDAFLAKYSLKFPPELQPASNIFARHYREFRRMKKEVDDLLKVRSAAESSMLPTTEIKQLGDFRVILKSEPPAATFKDFISLLRAHEILLNSYAMAGTADRGSKLHAGIKVNEFSLSDALAYRTFAAERLRRYPGTVNQAIQWFLDRDRQTHLSAGALYAEGFPFGEALRQSFEHKTAVLWQVGSVGLIDEPTRPKRLPTETPQFDDSDAPNPKRARVPRAPSGQADLSTGKVITLQNLCDAWNKGKCTKKQADCPEKLLHRCNVPVGSDFCGAWQHSALQHQSKKV